jgi:hypothetical protein
MMNKLELKFLLKLNQEIDRACQLLNTERENFIPVMTNFFQAVSLGVDMGRSMKGQTPSQPKKVDGRSNRNHQPGRPAKIAQILKNAMKKGPQPISALTSSVAHLLKDSASPAGYVSRFLHESKKDFVRVGTGIYKNK